MTRTDPKTALKTMAEAAMMMTKITQMMTKNGMIATATMEIASFVMEMESTTVQNVIVAMGQVFVKSVMVKAVGISN